MQANVTIPGRFNGPPRSGNGGYSCGVVASFIDGPARVRLHVPPPLDVSMQVVRQPDGTVELFDGDTLVGSGGPISYTLEIPTPPDIASARDAMTRFIATEKHLFATCFVCGPGRPDCDGLELFPGPVVDWNLLACVWQPAADLLDSQGYVRPEVMWAALDCPGFFAAMGDTLRPAVLGQLEGELCRPVAADEPLVVFSWPLGSDGRKHYGGTAVATAAGEVVASSHSTWIELKSPN